MHFWLIKEILSTIYYNFFLFKWHFIISLKSSNIFRIAYNRKALLKMLHKSYINNLVRLHKNENYLLLSHNLVLYRSDQCYTESVWKWFNYLIPFLMASFDASSCNPAQLFADQIIKSQIAFLFSIASLWEKPAALLQANEKWM